PAPPGAEGGAALEEEVDVAADLGGDLVAVEPQVEEQVERLDHGRGVGAAAAHAAARGDPLDERGAHPGDLPSLRDGPPGLLHRVGPGQRRTVDLQGEALRLADRERVVDRHGGHDGGKLVVAVGPAAQDLEEQVELGGAADLDDLGHDQNPKSKTPMNSQLPIPNKVAPSRPPRGDARGDVLGFGFWEFIGIWGLGVWFFLHDDVVDEARLADADGESDERLALDLLHGLEGVGVDDRDVLDEGALHPADDALHL